MITLYHTNCPKCKILESKLKSKNIQYNEITDINQIMDRGIKTIPQLEIDGNLLDFYKSIQFVNGIEKKNESDEHTGE